MASREEYMKKYGATTLGIAKKEKEEETRRALSRKPVAAVKQKTESPYDYTPVDLDRAVVAGKAKQKLFFDDPVKQNMARSEYGTKYDYITPKEKTQFFYLTGKYGEEEGQTYLKAIERQLREREISGNAKRIEEATKALPFQGLIYNVFTDMMSGIGYAQDFAASILGKEIDPLSNAHEASAYGDASREGIKQAVRETGIHPGVGDFLTDTGISLAQSAARLPFGAVGLVSAGLTAGTKAEEDALERGASKWQALGSGAAAGVAEGVFERASLGSLKSMKAAPVYGVKDIGKNLLKQAAVEGSEEMATELANTVSDRLIMGEKSNLELAKEAYEAAGEGSWRAYLDAAQQIGLAGLGGALSGGIMGGGAMALGGLEQSLAGKNSGLSDFQEIADTIDTDPASYQNEQTRVKAENLKTLAQSYADQQARGEEVSDLQRGGFLRDYAELASNINEEAAQQNTAQENQDTSQVGKENREEGSRPTVTPEQERQAQEADIQQLARAWAAEQNPELEAIQEVAPVQLEKHHQEPEDIRDFGNFGPNGQQAFADNYDDAVRIGDYRKAFGRYYDAGRYDAEMETAERAAISAILTPEQASAAYRAGALDRNQALSAHSALVQGEAKTGGAVDLSGRASDTQMNFAKAMGKKTGLTFELVSGEDGKAGAYNPKKGTIRLAVDSANFLQTTSHELTHFIRDYSPANYEGYKQMAIQALMNADSLSYDDMVERYESKYREAGQNLTREEITEEIAADATGRFLNDEEFIANLTRDNRPLAQKIRDFLSDVVDAIRSLISGKGISKAAEGLRENLEYYENARDMWAYGIEEASKQRKSGKEVKEVSGSDNQERYEIAKPEMVTEEQIEQNYEKVRRMDSVSVIQGDEFSGSVQELRSQIMELYQSYGNKVHNDVVGDIYLTGRSIRDDLSHGIGRKKAAAFAAVKGILEKGYVLRHSENWKGRNYDAVVIGGKITIEQGENAGDYYAVCVVRVGEDNRLYLHEVDIKKTDSVPFYYDQDKLDKHSGHNYPSISSIFEKLRSVNGQGEENGDIRYRLEGIDLPGEDSDGNQLTAAQRDFFKDSVVRDEEGRLLVVYHGTPNAGFTEFRSGSYFTEKKWYADFYQDPSASMMSVKQTKDNPDTYQVYLNIKKPFDTRIPSIRKIWDEEFYRQWGTGTPLMESGLPDWTDGMDIQEFIEENELDFDGIILDEGGIYGDDGEVISRGLSYITFKPEQVKNVSNKEPSGCRDIRYQLKDIDAEETENLVAIHNLPPEKLMKALSYEGLAMPSIAVTKADLGHEKFGGISLVFRKDTIDPANKKNKVYSADAWTPTFPVIDYEADERVIEQMQKSARRASGNIPEMYVRKAALLASNLEDYLQQEKGEDGVFEKIKDKIELKALYLAENGETVETIRKEVRQVKEKKEKYDDILKVLGNNPETIRRLPLKELKEKYGDEISDVLRKHGDTEDQIDKFNQSNLRFQAMIMNVLDYAAQPEVSPTQIVIDESSMKQDIESRVDQKKYEDWLKDLLKGLEKGTGIWNGKNYMTSSENRRSFKQLHYAVTAENIVKAMLKSGSEKNNDGFHGIKTVRAEIADEFKSIEEIRAQSYRLGDTDTEEYENKLEDLESRLAEVIGKIQSGRGRDRNVFLDMENIGNLILKAAKNPTVENMKKVMKEGEWRVSETQAKEIASIIREVKELPVNLFEAKPQRVVGYDEIAAAVVPETTDPKVIAALEEKGIRVVPYKEDQPGDRKRVINQLEGVRFQLEDVDQDTEYTDLARENEELREANKALKHQLELTKDYEPRMEDIKKTARELKKTYHSSISMERLTGNLSKLYNYMHAGEGKHMEEIDQAAQAIADSILRNASLQDEIRDQYKDVLSHIRKTRMRLPESYRSELEPEGGYDAFRKKYFGRLRLGNEGIDVDTAYEELSGLYPEFFPTDIINQADQLVQIAQVYESLQPRLQNPYHANMEEMRLIVAQEIKEEAVNIRALPPTKADKMQAEIFRAQRKYKEQTEAFKQRLKGEYEMDITKAEKEALAEAERKRPELVQQIHELAKEYRSFGEGGTKEEQKEIRRLKKENWEKQEALRQQIKDLSKSVDLDLLAGKMKYQRRRDAAESRKHRERIQKDVKELAKWLTVPTDQKHVPEALRSSLADFLSGIDTSSSRTNTEGEPTQRTKQWWDLSEQFRAIAEQGGDSVEGESVYMDVDPDLVQKMSSLKDKVKDFDKLENLDLKDLRTLRDVVASMKHSIQEANKMFENQTYERVSDVAKGVLRDNSSRKTRTHYADPRDAGKTMLQSDMLDAGTMFNRFGPSMESIYGELRAGLDQKFRNTKQAQEYMENLLDSNHATKKEIREWTGKRAKIQKFEVQGGEIELTPAQVMSLYVLNKREAARGHIYNKLGGIKSKETIRKTKKGYVLQGGEHPVAVTAADVQQIVDTLTQEQKDIADGIVKFFTTVTSSWGNDVSMRMYGYKKFNAKNYFPIVTDKNYIASKESELGATLTTLRNMGSTKHTIPGANNPILIEDIFDVYTRQADQMGSYHAFVIPLADLQKVLNYKEIGVGSVKETLERAFGKNGLRYIRDLMVDLNGTSASNPNYMAAFTRNMKAAAVGANLRTAIQQPTAYVRAAAEINPKYLIKGLKLHVKAEEWERVKKYAPIAYWKDMGYFDIHTGRTMKNIMMGPESTKERLTEASMWLTGKGDQVAWVRIWEAAKAETKDRHPELKEGSEAFYQRAGARFSQIIDRTQVVDTVLHRSQLMKRKDGLTQMYTSFMSEPTKTYNMLYRAFADLAIKKDAKSRKRAAKIVGIYFANAAATALAASVVDALRDDENEKDLDVKYQEALIGNLIDNLNPLNSIPLVKDVVGIFQGYSVKRTDMQAFQELYYTMQKWHKKVANEDPEEKSELTYPALIQDSAKAISTLFGVPISNLLRDLDGIVNTFIQCSGNGVMEYRRERWLKDIESPGNVTEYVTMAMRAYAEGEEELGNQILQDLKETEIEDIEKKIKTRYVKILKEDPQIIEAAEAKKAGRLSEYTRIIAEMEEDGYGRDYLIAAVSSAVKTSENEGGEKETERIEVKTKEAEEAKEEATGDSLYSYSDLPAAFENSNADFQMAVNELIKEKKKEGKEEKEVISQIKSTFTSKYKELYVSGNQAERLKIRQQLYRLKVKGKQLYDDKDFKRWIKEK